MEWSRPSHTAEQIMIRIIDTEALRARREAIDQEIARYRDAIAALEQRRSELEIGERIIAEFATEQGAPKDESPRREASTSEQEQSDQKRPRKPEGLPTVPEMIVSALRDARARGSIGMVPAEVTAFIRRNYWPEVPPESVTPIVWRMWKKDGVLEKDGARYVLPEDGRPHNGASGTASPDAASNDLLSKTRGTAFLQAGLQ
jgi:hypothetical protein